MKNIKKAVFVISMLLSGHLSAATITWSSSTTNVNVDDVFTIDIVGTDFLSNVDGGGVNISFDQSVLNVLSVSINGSVWDFGGFGISTGTIDNSNGTVDGIMVNTFSDVFGDFVVATIEVMAIAEGDSLLSLTKYLFNPWASGGSLINPDFVDASVHVTAVPVPAAAWLLGSGLLSLFIITRRKFSYLAIADQCVPGC
jgi:hypothetical protein